MRTGVKAVRRRQMTPPQAAAYFLVWRIGAIAVARTGYTNPCGLEEVVAARRDADIQRPRAASSVARAPRRRPRPFLVVPAVPAIALAEFPQGEPAGSQKQ